MPTSERALHIDIPAKLEELRIAFSIASLAFEGDLPTSIFHLQLHEGPARMGRRFGSSGGFSHQCRPRDVE